jgi:hypothetical protein
MKRITILISGLSILMGAMLTYPIAAQCSTDDINSKTFDITGYGDYVLGSTLQDITDISSFTGPVVDNGLSTEIIEYSREDVFNCDTGTAHVNHILGYNNDKLDWIMIDFDNLVLDFDNLDDLSLYVAEIRDALIEIYDGSMVILNDLSLDYPDDEDFRGICELQDLDGDRIYLLWDGFSLSVTYCSASLASVVDASMAEGDDSKL